MTFTQDFVIIIVFIVVIVEASITSTITKGQRVTISTMLLDVSKRWPVIALLAFGIIVGHVFWANC